jgi:hypothetical protein
LKALICLRHFGQFNKFELEFKVTRQPEIIIIICLKMYLRL